jgi:chemotaxis protein histidine kinase CheA
MNDIRRVLRAASWRLFLTGAAKWLVLGVMVVLAGAIVTRIIQQGTAWDVPWQAVAMWAPVGVLALALLLGLVTRPDRAATARRVDEGADLREALSTALWAQGQDDPWSRAAVESAAARARTVNVRQAVPVTAPRSWPWIMALAVALVIAWFVIPPFNLMGEREKNEAAQAKMRQVAMAQSQADEAKKKVEQIANKLNLDKDEPAPEAPTAPETPKTPEEIRLNAVRQLTAMKDKLDELKQSPAQQGLKAIQDKLQNLKTPGEGPLTELSKQLSLGNFDKASAELQKLAEKMANNAMSPEDRSKAQEQLKQLASQLAQAAQEKKELEKKLSQAGLDPKLASDPKALSEALKKSENLTQEQKDQLQQQAQAQQQCQNACESMSQSMNQMAQSMSQQGMNQQAQQSMEQMADQLSQLEQMNQEMAAAQAAEGEVTQQLEALSSFSESDKSGMGACKNGLSGDCQGEKDGEWREGWNESKTPGRARGGPGQANGGHPGAAEAAIDREKRKFKSPNQGGPIISSRLIEGEQIKGESKAEFAAAVVAADQAAAEAIDNNVIPREFHSAVKHYFGRLKTKADVKEAAPAAPSGPSAAPAAEDKK